MCIIWSFPYNLCRYTFDFVLAVRLPLDHQLMVRFRVIIHSGTEIQTPIDDVTCAEGCYKACSEISQDDDLINKGSDVTLRFFYLHLSDLPKYVGTNAKRVFVYAQTVLIDENMELPFALLLRTRQLFVDRSRASYIGVMGTVTAELDIDFSNQIPDPEPDTLHQKQSMMCAR